MKVVYGRIQFQLIRGSFFRDPLKIQRIHAAEQFDQPCLPELERRAVFLCTERGVADLPVHQHRIRYAADLFFGLADLLFVFRAQIGAEAAEPELPRDLRREPLEFPDDLRVILRKAPVGVIHLRQLEDGMTHGKRVHVDHQHFAARKDDVLRMIVAMDHMVAVRDRLDHAEQFSAVFFRQRRLQSFRRAADLVLDGGQFPFGHGDAVDLLQHIGVFLYTPVHALRFLRQDLRERSRIQQFKDRTIAFADADNVV